MTNAKILEPSELTRMADKKIRVLGIAASPRKNGNSHILLDKVLAGASSKGAKVEKVVLSRLDIRPCQGGEKCRMGGVCFIKDDMVQLYKKLKEADAIVVASPVYFGSVPAQLKAVIDRCQSVWVENFLVKKKREPAQRRGIFISVSGHNKRRFFQNSREIVKIFFMILRVDLFKALYVPNLESEGQVLKQKAILDKAFRYGVSLSKGHPARACSTLVKKGRGKSLICG